MKRARRCVALHALRMIAETIPQAYHDRGQKFVLAESQRIAREALDLERWLRQVEFNGKAARDLERRYRQEQVAR